MFSVFVSYINLLIIHLFPFKTKSITFVNIHVYPYKNRKCVLSYPVFYPFIFDGLANCIFCYPPVAPAGYPIRDYERKTPNFPPKYSA